MEMGAEDQGATGPEEGAYRRPLVAASERTGWEVRVGAERPGQMQLSWSRPVKMGPDPMGVEMKTNRQTEDETIGDQAAGLAHGLFLSSLDATFERWPPL